MSDRIGNELFVFKHFGKCGGSSLRNSIREAFAVEESLFCYRTRGASVCQFVFEEYVQSRGHTDKDKLWDGYYELINNEVARPCVKIVYGHTAPFPGRITSRPARYYTMMRHPLTRIVSSYNMHFRKGNTRLPFDKFVESTPPRREKKEILRQYDRIYFFEEYADSIKEISSILGRELAIRRENVSTRENTGEKFLERSTETDVLIYRYCSDELELYEYARSIF